MPEVHGKPVVIPNPTPEPTVSCSHWPDPSKIRLDCEPTNEWTTVCEDCGVTLWAQSEDKPGDNPHEWEEWS